MNRLAFVLVLVAPLAACSEHEPELGHIGGAGSSGAGDGGSVCAPGPSVAAPAYPCEIFDILSRRCHRCHTDPPQNGAPFPLLTWEDTQEEYFGGKQRWQFMKNAIKSDFMPLTALALDPPVQPLTAEEKATLLEWVECARPVEKVACPDAGP